MYLQSLNHIPGMNGQYNTDGGPTEYFMGGALVIKLTNIGVGAC